MWVGLFGLVWWACAFFFVSFWGLPLVCCVLGSGWGVFVWAAVGSFVAQVFGGLVPSFSVFWGLSLVCCVLGSGWGVFVWVAVGCLCLGCSCVWSFWVCLGIVSVVVLVLGAVAVLGVVFFLFGVWSNLALMLADVVLGKFIAPVCWISMFRIITI